MDYCFVMRGQLIYLLKTFISHSDQVMQFKTIICLGDEQLFRVLILHAIMHLVLAHPDL